MQKLSSIAFARWRPFLLSVTFDCIQLSSKKKNGDTAPVATAHSIMPLYLMLCDLIHLKGSDASLEDQRSNVVTVELDAVRLS